MLYLKLAWRNIWRNKRRTFITLFIIVIAVTLAILMRSQQEGSYELMIRNTAGTFIGHIQIHQKGYWEEQNLDHSLEENKKLLKKIKAVKGIQSVVPRLESYALLAGKEKSRAGLVVGIDPDAEKLLSNPPKKLIQGQYFGSSNEPTALIGEGLAKFLDLEIGDSIVVIGQGYQAQNAVGKYQVKGIFKFPTPDQNKSMVYLPLSQAQELFLAFDRLTSYSVITKKPKDVIKITKRLKKTLNSQEYEVMNWQTMLPELEQMIVTDRVSGMIMIGILYMVVGFGIFGTIIMMTAERRFEFGVLIGIGMNRFKLGLTILLEILMLSFLGTLLGCVLIAPLIWYFYYHPIKITGDMAKAVEELGLEPLIVYSKDIDLFIAQGWIVFFITMLIALYPLWLMARIKVVEAMRS